MPEDRVRAETIAKAEVLETHAPAVVVDSPRPAASRTWAAGPVVILWSWIALDLAPSQEVWRPFMRDALQAHDFTFVRITTLLSLLTFAWAFLVDRVPLIGTRREGYLIFGGLFSACAWMAVAFLPPEAVPWTSLMALAGLGFGVAVAATRGALADHAHRCERYGVIAAALSGASPLCALIYRPVYLFAGSPRRTAIVAAILPLSVVVLVIWRILARSSGQPAETLDAFPAEPTPWPSVPLRRYLCSRRFWSVVAVGTWALAARTPSILLEHPALKLMTLPDEAIWRCSMIADVAGMLAAIGYGALSRRAPPRVLLPMCLLATAAGTLACLAMPEASTPLLEVASACSGVGAALGAAAFLHVALRALPRRSEAIAFALVIAAPNALVRAAVVPVVVSAKLSFSTTVLGAAACAAVGALLAAVWIPRTLTAQPDGAVRWASEA